MLLINRQERLFALCLLALCMRGPWVGIPCVCKYIYIYIHVCMYPLYLIYIYMYVSSVIIHSYTHVSVDHPI